MKRMRIMGLCLVAAVAMSAVAVSSASAFTREAPEVGRCLAHAGGKWKDGGCKVKETATEKKFEWYPAFGEAANGETKLAPKVKFTSASKEEALIQLETVKAEVIVCKGTDGKGKEGQTSNGEVTGPKTNVATEIIFRGCEIPTVGKCKSTKPVAANEGEIKVNNLNGTIGIEKTALEKSKEKVANLFVPASGETFTEFSCAGVPVVVENNPKEGGKGGVMQNVTANAMKITATVKFSASKGKQKPEKFAADPTGTKRVLFSNKLGGEFIQAGQTLTTIQKNEEKLEVSTLE